MKNKKKQYYTFLIIFYILFAAIYGFIIYNMIFMAKKFDNPIIYFMFIPILLVGVGAIFTITRVIKNRERINRVFEVEKKVREVHEEVMQDLDKE